MNFRFLNTRLRPLLSGAAGLLATALPAAAQTPAESHHDEVALEELHIITSPLPQTTGEFSQSATVLEAEAIRRRQEPSLGETLDGLPGVSSTYFGPGASRPIIRGLGGERIRVLTDGLGSIDVSATSPDHAISLEPALSQRVEILRGPSILLHGSSAVGGVVNVIDERVPASAPETPISGVIEGRYDSGSDGRTGVGALRGGTDKFAWQISGLRRSSDDVDIPGFAEHEHHDDDHHEEEGEEDHDEHEEHEEAVAGTLPNSAIDTTSGSIGAAWFWDGGTAGLAYSIFDTRYGVPGHAHEDEHEEGEEEEEHGEEHGGVRIDLEQRRWDFRAELTEPFGIFRSGRFSAGIADYTHVELEGDEIGTRFDTTGGEFRLELLHQSIGPFEGAVGAHYQHTKFEAEGAEAFLPPTRTSNGALFILEELQTEAVRWQFGARLEAQDIAVRDGSGLSRDKDALSLSVGGLWKISDPWALAVSIARSERLPTAQELFADGPHLATSAYEIGDADLGKEKSTGLDLDLRRRLGVVTGSVGVFLNDFDKFIFENPTGETEDDLPVYRYVAKDARLYGAEAQVIWHAHNERGRGFDLIATVDTVRGTNETDNIALPRLPPWRVSLGFVAAAGRWSAGAEVRHAFEQEHIAPYEESSDSYTLVSASLGYTLPLERGAVQLFVRGTNLTDEEARPHTSFLREVAPLPGRNVSLGARWTF